MSVLLKFVVLTYVLAIPLQVPFARLKKANVILLYLKVNQINYDTPENSRNKILFENLTPLIPNRTIGYGVR